MGTERDKQLHHPDQLPSVGGKWWTQEDDQGWQPSLQARHQRGESSWGIHLGQQLRSAELKNLGDVNQDCTPAPIRVWD